MKRQFEGFALQGNRLADDPSRSYEEPKVVQALAPKDDSDFQDYDLIAGCGDRVRGNTSDFTCTDTNNEVEEEIDPLDAFMAEIETTVSRDQPCSNKKARLEVEEEEDHVAEFLERRQQRQKQQQQQSQTKNALQPDPYYSSGRIDGVGEGYNSDEEVYAAARAADALHGGGGGGGQEDDEETFLQGGKKREIDSLAAANHAEIDYEDFNKEFYQPVAELQALTAEEIARLQQAVGIRVSGYNVCAPVESFSQCNFDAPLLKVIEKAGYVAPTPIQSQAMPIILSGKDVVGVAKTGSGKTAAFVLPMLVHIMDQRELTRGEGPIALIVAPTRELAEQIHREARKFSRPYKLNICAAFGGLAKHQQIKEMKQGVEVAVCTPGRMIDLIKAKACALKRTTYVVLDEADRMFDLGFEPQIRSLLGQTRPDRQTLLFSATMPRSIESLAADALASPVRITVGVTGTANEDVKQIIEFFSDDDGKQRWLIDHVPGFVDEGEVLIFANQKNKVEYLAEKIENLGIAKVGAIHGDLSQASRMEILSSFKKGIFHVLVATDVAARGLDIKTLKTVVNYDAAKDIDTHVHRIGRTGRAGDKEGTAYTLLLRNETRAAGDLVRCLVAAGQEVPERLHEMAMRDPRAQKGRGGVGGRRGGVGGRGGRFSGGNSQPLAPSGGGLGFSGPNSATAHQNQPGCVARTGITGFAPSHTPVDAHFTSIQTEQQKQKPLPPPPGPPPPSSSHAVIGKHFQGTFVSSGTTTGHSGGCGEPRAEILLPPSRGGGGGVSLGGRPLPPPPVPVSQQPLYMQHRPSPPPSHYGNQKRPQYQTQPPPLPSQQQQQQQNQSQEVANAIARAKEIAARLTAQQQQSRRGS